MKSEKFTVKVDGEKRQVIAVDLLSDITPSETALDKVHHIMLLDRSHSMHYEINGLIDDVKKSFESIGDEDYLSIIWFSSPGQFKTVIKGAKKTDDIKKLLDSMRSTIGTTCFSDPLKEAESIIDDLAAICGNILVTLFTDGNPVVPWTITEEKKRVFESIGRLNGKVIGVNTIGYGHYYDRNFLQEVADETEFGMFRHSNQITQFHPLFMKNYESVTEMTGMAIDVKCEGAEFMYLGSKIAKLSKELSLSSSDSKRSTLFIVSKTAPNFELNGDVVKAKGVKSSKNDELKKDFLYAYASRMYYAGRRQEALDIMAKNVRDKSIVDMMINAFTYDEVANVQEAMDDATFDIDSRLISGVCPGGYIPKSDALCVMDVLKMLADGGAKYVPYSDHDHVESYARIGRETKDNSNQFTWGPNPVHASMSDFVWNKEKMNLSIRFRIDGTVTLNKKSAERVKLPLTVDSHIYRTHTVIKDGNVNLPVGEFLVSERLLVGLRSAKTPIEVHESNVTDEKLTSITIDFKLLPIVNRTYIDRSQSIEDLFNLTTSLTKAEAAQKVVKKLLSDVYDKLSIAKKDAAFKGYTVKQIEVLEENGLDKHMSYHPVNSSKSAAGESDSYEVRTMYFYLRGVSSLPKIDDKVLSGEKKTLSAKLIKEAYDTILNGIEDEGLDLEKPNMALKKYLQEEVLTGIQKGIMSTRTTINTLKMAKLLTGDWFTGLETDDKGNYLYESGDMTMIARTDRTTEYV